MVGLRQLWILLYFLSTSAGDVVFWRPTSNWNDPSNWSQSRLPCSAETVVLSAPKSTNNGMKLPSSFDVSIQGDIAIKKLIIPKMGSISLGRNVKIALKRAATCKDEGLPAVTDDSVNSFIGAKPRPWNCPTNWRLIDGTYPGRSPCRDDSVVFPANNTFSWVMLNAPITVARLGWQGRSVEGLSDIPNYEKQFFKSTPTADLTVSPSCLAGSPERCPCQVADESPLCIYPSTVLPTVLPTVLSTGVLTGSPAEPGTKDSSAGGGGQFPWPILVGALGGLVLILIVVIVVVVVVRRRRRYRYDNDDEPPFTGDSAQSEYYLKSQQSSTGFKNPLYDESEVEKENPIYVKEPQDTLAYEGLYDTAE